MPSSQYRCMYDADTITSFQPQMQRNCSIIWNELNVNSWIVNDHHPQSFLEQQIIYKPQEPILLCLSLYFIICCHFKICQNNGFRLEENQFKYFNNFSRMYIRIYICMYMYMHVHVYVFIYLFHSFVLIYCIFLVKFY